MLGSRRDFNNIILYEIISVIINLLRSILLILINFSYYNDDFSIYLKIEYHNIIHFLSIFYILIDLKLFCSLLICNPKNPYIFITDTLRNEVYMQ